MLEIPAIIIYTLLQKIFSFLWGGGPAQTRPKQIDQTVENGESSVKVSDDAPPEASNDSQVQPEKSPEPAKVLPEPEKPVEPSRPAASDGSGSGKKTDVEPGPVVEPSGGDSASSSGGADDFVVEPSGKRVSSPAQPPSPEVLEPFHSVSSPDEPESDESPDIEELKIASFTGTSGTVVEMPAWDVEGAAEKIYKACKGLGTTEADITEVVCSINNAQRQQLREKYLAMYGEDLMDRLKSELNGRFQDVIIGLMTPPDEYLADWLRWALQGAGTEEDTLVEVLCCRTNDEIERIKEAYKKKYERELDDDIESDLDGQFQKLIRAVLACGRDESGNVDGDLAVSDAQELFDAGAAQWGTDESKFNAILCTRSFPHLRRVFKVYANISGADITEAIDSEFTGDVQAGLLAIVAVVRDPAAYYASKLHLALDGAGTRDNILIRIIVSRSEVDLKDIKEAYAAKYEESLAEKVAADTRGDYEEALLKILG